MNKLYVLIEESLGPFTKDQVTQIKKNNIQKPLLSYFVKKKAIYIKDYFNHSNEDEKHLYDVIMKMLVVDPTKRISLTEALNLPFFSKFKKKNAITDSFNWLFSKLGLGN